jgi:GTP-binding protein Era
MGHAGKIAIVGRPNVGKSTLLNALLGERIAITSPHPQTTRDRIAGVVTQKDAQFVFLDTPGLQEAPRNKLGAIMNQLARDAAREADVVLWVTDSLTPALPKADATALAALPEGLPAVLLLNKIDRLERKDELFPVLEGLGKNERFRAIIPVSARKRDGVERIFDEVRPLLPEQDPLFPEDELSDKPVRFFVSEFVREQILKKTRQEVPHGVAVVVERFEEPTGKKKVTVIELAIHVDREAHKKILIGKHGQLLKTIGIAARERVEAMLGRQVHLQLWVRVTPGWAEREQTLRDFGYAGLRSDGEGGA